MAAQNVFRRGDLSGSNKSCDTDTPPPSTSEALSNLGGLLIAGWVVAALVVVLQLGLFVRLRRIVSKAAPEGWRNAIYWQYSIFPFSTLLALGTLVVPGSYNFLRSLTPIWVYIAASKFVELTVRMLDGEENILALVGEKRFPLASYPFSACSPHRKLSWRLLRSMRRAVGQAQYLLAAAAVTTVFLEYAGVIERNQANPGKISKLLTAIGFLSLLLGLAGLRMFTNLVGSLMPPGHHYEVPSLVLKLAVFTSKPQILIFNKAFMFSTKTCISSTSPWVYAGIVESIVLSVEMLLFSLLVYRTYSDVDQYSSEESKQNPCRE
ncbi:uncharacterized protein LOC119104192 [Pollicipes pollicipes]|uniref:uncharacterized protein LOC119104192 n=1 Tax=Pollicipes pollicipes TaxID=41117 RepID=UPI001884E2FF|nr:uncharacterized protein LOC119104192 [Pollicipes pollicipes]